MQRVLIIGLLIWASFTNNLFAIEKLYIDDKGFRHYSCGSELRGARIAIKDIGRDRYRVKSSIFAGIMELPPDKAPNRWCIGLLGAVRTLCGECKVANSQETLDDKIKQLGLNRAE